MIHESERTRIISHVETELFLDIEPIERMVEDLESTWANRSFESPDDHFEPLRSALETYHEEFLFRDMPWSNIEHCLSQIANSIDRLNEYYDEPEDDYSEYMDSIMDSVDKTEGRSIFDDLDE